MVKELYNCWVEVYFIHRKNTLEDISITTFINIINKNINNNELFHEQYKIITIINLHKNKYVYNVNILSSNSHMINTDYHTPVMDSYLQTGKP